MPPQSWYDLPFMSPMDPRNVISFCQLTDQAGAQHSGVFLNSTTFLKNTTWQASPLTLSPIASNTTPQCAPVSGIDFNAIYIAQAWNASHGLVANNTQLPQTVQRIIFGKAGKQFMNTYYFDFPGGTTSTDIQLSYKDNSAVAGNFLDSSSGTIPVFGWSGATFGGTGKSFTIGFRRAGRFLLCLRVIDNAGNYSMFEMDLNASD